VHSYKQLRKGNVKDLSKGAGKMNASEMPVHKMVSDQGIKGSCTTNEKRMILFLHYLKTSLSGQDSEGEN
jgi:hypothetical protein